MDIKFIWTDGNDEIFRHFYRITEDYYSALVGGAENRTAFMPYNLSSAVENVLIVYYDDAPAACAGLKRYSDTDAEIKRVWVEPEYRGQHIASEMMKRIEGKARERGFERTVLQTREIMTDAVGLYSRLGYTKIPAYPPYDKLEGAVCFAKELM